MAWYIARSLDKLLAQLNALAPRRSKVSDGGIGDAAHDARTSDHNPIAGTGQVCARDFTHDPAGGLDCGSLAARLVGSRDARIKYVIWNRQIWTPSVGWRSYTGQNPHTSHLHLSVKAGSLGDNTTPWNLGATEGNEVELGDHVTLFDGSKVTVNNLLAGVFARLADPIQSKEYPHVKAPLLDFVTGIDQNVINTLRNSNRIDEVEAKVDGLIAGLNGLVLKVNELLERTEPRA